MNTPTEGAGPSGRVRNPHRPMIDHQQRRIADLTSKTLPHLPRRMFTSNERNTVCFASHLRGDYSSNAAAPPPPPPAPPIVTHEAAGDCALPETPSSRKLKVRGLAKFRENHTGTPPSWVKEFPCRSRFHPDMYLYNFEEGPFNPKRNLNALNQCQNRGGRCTKCGIYVASLCQSCNYCDADCECPENSGAGQSAASDAMLNPFDGMPSMESFGSTLTKAQQILTSSQNAPRQYPFKLNADSRRHRPTAPECQSPAANPTVPSSYPQQMPFLAPPMVPYQSSYQPYPYGYPPLPYMIPPPPPIYGYSYPPPPFLGGYPQPPMPMPLPQYPPVYAYPYQQNQQVPNSQPPSVNHTQAKPTCRTTISVNNDDSL